MKKENEQQWEHETFETKIHLCEQTKQTSMEHMAQHISMETKLKKKMMIVCGPVYKEDRWNRVWNNKGRYTGFESLLRKNCELLDVCCCNEDRWRDREIERERGGGGGEGGRSKNVYERIWMTCFARVQAFTFSTIAFSESSLAVAQRPFQPYSDTAQFWTSRTKL